MGDVGALALGGALGTIAVITRQEIVLAIMGGVFVVEALSVMAQVTWFKYTQQALRRGPAHSSRWRRCTTTSRSRLEGDPGRRPLLDHHDAAVPGRPGDPEAAMTMKHLQDTTVLVLGLGESGPGDGALVRALRRAGARVADTRDDAAERWRRCASRCRGARCIGGALDAAARSAATVC